VVIHNLHVEGVIVVPTEADPPSVIDADGVLTCSIPLEFLPMIGGRYPQIIEADGAVQHPQLAQRRPQKIVRQSAGSLPPEDPFRLFVCERSDHAFKLPHLTLNVKRYSLPFVRTKQTSRKMPEQLTRPVFRRILCRVTVINRQW
jgi:hypothetical protein